MYPGFASFFDKKIRGKKVKEVWKKKEKKNDCTLGTKGSETGKVINRKAKSSRASRVCFSTGSLHLAQRALYIDFHDREPLTSEACIKCFRTNLNLAAISKWCRFKTLVSKQRLRIKISCYVITRTHIINIISTGLLYTSRTMAIIINAILLWLNIGQTL